MATENEQKLAEAVRKYPVLYDKQDKYFKDKKKKTGVPGCGERI